MNATAYLPPPSLKQLPAYDHHLVEAERSEATREKYLRDIRAFYAFVGTEKITKEKVLSYRSYLTQHYEDTSTNSMLSALNGFFAFCKREDLRVKQLKIQNTLCLSEERELTKQEYQRLLQAAEQTQDYRIKFIMQTLFATGMRVSELKYITAESVRRGTALVDCKGKRRTVYISDSLQKLLRLYMASRSIVSGPVFIDVKGKPLSRHYVWRAMKDLCSQAGVVSSKVFPHNLRHLFARCFYALEKDLVKLANILGHTSINTTRIYAQETVAAHRRAMNKIKLLC